MPRPEYLNCVMTPGIIRSIRNEQEQYDSNPEQAEREQRVVEEDRQERMRQERESYEREQDRSEV